MRRLFSAGRSRIFCPTASPSRSCPLPSAARSWHCAARCRLPSPGRTARSPSSLPPSSPLCRRGSPPLAPPVLKRVAAGSDADLLGPAIIAMALATALTGLLMCVLGFTHAGRAIRFLPYPVIGGFLGATGWLMVTGAIQVVTDRHATLANLGAFADAMTGAKLAAGAAVAVILHVLLRRTKNPFALPGVLLASFAATYCVLLVSGTSVGAAQASGWMFHPQPAAALALPWKTAALHAFPWGALPSFAGDVLAVMFVTMSTLLLNTTGIEIATRSEANIERDLKVHGLANLLTGGLGGMVVCTSLSRSIL